MQGRTRSFALWAALAALWLGLRLQPLLEWAPTYDEPIYMAAGRHFAAHADGRTAALLYHPPLAYHLTSLPLWFVETPLPAWDPTRPASQVGLEVLYGSALSPRTMLVLSRLPVLLLSLLGMEVMRRLGNRIGGARAGWLSAAVWVVHPEVAAQSVLATTDLVATVATLVLALATLRHIERTREQPERSWGTLLAVGASAGAGLLAKHSLLFPVLIATAALVVARWSRRRRGEEVPRRPFARAAAAAGVAFLAIWAGYLFETGPVAARDAGGPNEHTATLARLTGLDPSTVDRLAEGLPIPAPTYVRSLADALLEKARVRTGGPWVAYLKGEWSERGFLAYFPIALAVKTPTALLALLALGIAAWPFLRRRHAAAADLFLTLFALPFAAAVVSRLNIGVRHILPAVPFALLLGCGALAALWERRPRLGGGLVAALAALLAVEWVANWGEPLSFANLPSGGPDRLHRMLADTNLEAGQDLWAVFDWAEEHDVQAMHVLVHDPQGLYAREVARRPYLRPRTGGDEARMAARVRAEDQRGPVPRAGLLALGESVLVRPAYVRLANVEPLARVGRTRIYAVPE